MSYTIARKLVKILILFVPIHQCRMKSTVFGVAQLSKNDTVLPGIKKIIWNIRFELFDIYELKLSMTLKLPWFTCSLRLSITLKFQMKNKFCAWQASTKPTFFFERIWLSNRKSYVVHRWCGIQYQSKFDIRFPCMALKLDSSGAICCITQTWKMKWIGKWLKLNITRRTKGRYIIKKKKIIRSKVRLFNWTDMCKFCNTIIVLSRVERGASVERVNVRSGKVQSWRVKDTGSSDVFKVIFQKKQIQLFCGHHWHNCTCSLV